MRSRAYYRWSPVNTSISVLCCGWYAASFIGEGAGGNGGWAGAWCGAAGAPEAQAPAQEPSAQPLAQPPVPSAQLPVPQTAPHWQQTVCTTHLIVGFSTSTGVLISFVRVRTAAHVGLRTGQQCSQPLQSFLQVQPTILLGPGTQKSSQTQL